ncbi:hypothetical protein OPV22_002634 [Ensete ventricosum]|uniref:Uncharacterized protein n=1 Tax=Ensete ventricosum TaxID=4639 RepID=A0AAV8RYM5_ENSVE|nr:hypothetical protein OPV22_002634 [Ensete ventricosum]RWV81729.1 hypothetical protein GW17_00056825 [Ensete ventricosum]
MFVEVQSKMSQNMSKFQPDPVVLLRCITALLRSHLYSGGGRVPVVHLSNTPLVMTISPHSKHSARLRYESLPPANGCSIANEIVPRDHVCYSLNRRQMSDNGFATIVEEEPFVPPSLRRDQWLRMYYRIT